MGITLRRATTKRSSVSDKPISNQHSNRFFLQNDSTLVLSGLLFLNARLRQIILVRVLGPFATQSHARLSRFWYLKLVSSVQAGGGNLGVGGGSYGFVVGTTEG
mmetsp:Transcript_2776/g.6017  ORF Transcript_2776/g.6017 Transcript_2776/m.6017 type:complete len:104 (-) Transcript_2776:35-346(-)